MCPPSRAHTWVCPYEAHNTMSFDQMKERLKQLIKEKAYQRGHFVLASGKTSDFYIDARKITLDPEGAYLVGELIFERLKADSVSAVGGLTLGADPIVSAVALTSYLKRKPIPSFIVRKETKEHGTGQVIEGARLKPGDRVVLVDDVLTTGGSFVEAAQKIEPLGVKVLKAICVMDRRPKEKRSNTLEGLGVPVEALLTIEEIHP